MSISYRQSTQKPQSISYKSYTTDTMAYNGLTTEYMVNKSTDPIFQPGNCQAPSNSHDNPDNGTDEERQACCLILSPNAVAVVV